MVEDFSNVLREWEVRDRERREQAKQEFIATCASNNIHKVEAEFNGCGDSGDIENVTIINTAGENVDYDGMAVEIRNVIESYLLRTMPGGWEINDGSSGQIWAYYDGRIGGEIGWNVVNVEYERLGEGTEDPKLPIPSTTAAPTATSKKQKARGGVP